MEIMENIILFLNMYDVINIYNIMNSNKIYFHKKNLNFYIKNNLLNKKYNKHFLEYIISETYLRKYIIFSGNKNIYSLTDFENLDVTINCEDKVQLKIITKNLKTDSVKYFFYYLPNINLNNLIKNDLEDEKIINIINKLLKYFFLIKKTLT